MLTTEQLRQIVVSNIRKRVKPIEKLTVKSFEDALRIWHDEDVLYFYENKAMHWEPKNAVSVFIPCAAWKPYYYSQSHKDGYLKALLPYLDKIDLFVVSEPLAIVPYCYSDEYPVKSYDYNPHKYFIGKLANPLAKQALTIFTERLGEWILKYHTYYKKKILILPKSWHLKVFLAASKRVSVSSSEYHIIKLKGRAFQSISNIYEQILQSW